LLTSIGISMTYDQARRTNVVAVEMAQGPSLLIVDDLESASDRELRQLCDLCERIDASFGCHIILGMRVRRPEIRRLDPRPTTGSRSIACRPTMLLRSSTPLSTKVDAGWTSVLQNGDASLVCVVDIRSC